MSTLETTDEKTDKAPKRSRNIFKRILLTLILTMVVTGVWVLLFPSDIHKPYPAPEGENTAAREAGRTVLFTGFDGLAHVAEEITLKAKLESRYLKDDIANATVACYVADQYLGEAQTDEEGFAVWRFMPQKTGNFTVVYQLPDDSKYKPKRAEGLLAVRTEDKPVLISDLDNTIIDISNYQFLFHNNESIPPVPGAPEILKELSRQYDIIYLTARDDLYVNVTKNWLDMYGLPRAPLFVCDLSEEPADQGEYKKEVLRQLKAKWPNITIGVGDKVHDAQAYLANGMAAYILGEHDELPENTITVKSWKEIQEKLKR